MSICVVVPVFDDWDNADLIIENFLYSNFENTTMLVVDNGSSSPNPQIWEKCSQSEKLSILRLQINVGFGGAVQEAIGHLQADWLVWMPGNMKVIPSEMKDFLGVVESSNQTTFIKAHRVRRPMIDVLKTSAASIVQSFVACTLLPDTGGTPSAIHSKSPLMELVKHAPRDYMFDSYILLRAKQLGLRVERPPVPYHKRLIGQSHWQTGLSAEIKLMARLTISIIKWKREPLFPRMDVDND
jgi:hypothetical protein